MSTVVDDEADTDLDALVETIADAGPDDARTVIPTAQAEALVARDVLGMSRPAAAETLAVSVYAIDDRLRRARDNTQAAVATTRALLETDAVHEDADDDLDALRNLLEYEEAEDAVSAAESDPDTEPDHAGLDADAAAWGRLMTLETVHEVTRGNGAVSVTLDDADDDARETVHEALDDLFLEVVGRTEYGTGGRETIRATYDAYRADVVDGSDDAGYRRNVLLLGGQPVPARTDGLADDVLEEIATTVERVLAVDLDDLEDGEQLGTITLDGNTWSFNPALHDELVDDGELVESEADDEADPQPDDADRRNVLLLGDTPIPDRTDRLSDDDLDELAATVREVLADDLDDLENGEILGTITLDADTWSFNPAEDLVDDGELVDQDADDQAEDDEEEEADGYTCEDCGDTFDTPSGLGGHRKYCDERDRDDDETDG